MSYDEYGHHTGLLTAASATRSPHRSASSRRTPETVSSSAYARSSSPLSTSARGSPVARKARYSSVSGSRSTDNSPLHLVDSQQQQQDHGAGCVGSSFVPVNRYNSSSHFSRGAAAIDDFSSTMMDPMDRRNPGGGGGSGPGGLVGSSGSSAMMANSGSHHRSRSATRASGSGMNRSYHSLDRDGHDREREFIPIREGRDLRDCSTERGMESLSRRDRSMDRSMMVEDELMYRESGGGGGGGLSAGLSRSSRQSPAVDLGLKALGGGGSGGGSRESYLMELQSQNTELSRELGQLKKELELTNQKLGSSMHSIKTFWSPELKKERALRKEESAKYSLINDQLKLLNSENQKQAMLVRQLEEELRIRSMQNPGLEVRQQMEALYAENEHLGREVAILRDTCKELELRIDTQKQTLQSRDESIKKLLEMLQTKGMGKDEERLMLHQMQTLAQKQLDELRTEITRRDQELLATGAKMKTLEEQHHDYQRHIAVLKESLCAKEEHYNMIQADVEELRQRLEEKNRLIEKKTQAALQATQERNRLSVELNEVRENADIKDRKINVLQRKLELQEATNGGAKAEETAALRRQIEEQRKQLEELRKANDQRSKQFQERERSLQNLEKQLQKRKESFDVLEAKLQQANNSPANAKGGDNQATNELRHILAEKEKELAQSKAEGQKAQNEMERLLQLVQMSQEEQFAKDKTIMELQEALRKRQMHNSPSPAPDRSNEAQNRTQVEQLTREKEELQATVIQYQKEIREYCDKITALQQALREKAQSFERLESKSADYDALIRQMEEKNRRLAEFEHMKEQLKAKEGQVRDLEACLKLVEETEQQLKDRLQKVEEMEQNLLVQSEQQTSERVQHLEAEVEKLKSENEAKEKGLDEVKAELRQRESVVEDLQYSLSKERLTVEELHTDVKFLQNTLDEFRQEFKTQKEELSNLQKKAKLLESELQHKDSSIDELLHSVTLKDKRIEELEGDIRMKEKTIDDLSLDLDSKEDNKEYGEENKTKEDTKVNESLQAVVVSQLQDRIEELEEALRESVCITADREVTLDREMSQRIKLEEKVGRLEQRLQSLQNAQSLKCPSCRPIKLQLQQLESKLAKLCAERRSHLHELFDMKQEALEAAISERDAQLALLEVSGIKTAKAAEQADSLRGDRKRLMDLMREQNEKRVKLLQEFEEPALIWRPSSGHEMDFEDDSNDNSGDRLASNSDPNNHPPLVDNR